MVKLTKEQKVALGVGLAAAGGYAAYKYLKPEPPVPVCTPGDEKCIGLDWCRCNLEGTAWDVIIPNATQCEVPIGTAVLYGTVTDNGTGSPIQGILVSCNGYAATTAPDGTYRIENIPPGTYTVTFSDPLERYETEVR